ncbi:hypothetical protein [Lentibacillus sp. CBA3610]|uniref:hypothetical protein n=1 Tax=Lentibacillus sp. CBA3610 TaxID=2518176 RepID=UPI0020D22475|nr:hypothetical protein [Lentibacillus sp. CBA3610]
MAEKISNIKRMEISEETIRKQHLDEVITALSENKEAVIKGIDLLATLHSSGTLIWSMPLLNIVRRIENIYGRDK